MPFKPQSGDNVPFIGSRARFNILCVTPTWVYHRMAPAAPFDGAPPATALKTAANLDPVVKAGRAEFGSLVHGGLFTLLAHYRMPMAVDAVDNPGGLTMQVVDSSGTLLRTVSGTTFKVAAGECLKIPTSPNGAYIGFLVRLDETKII